jgi:hypothetical protein
MNEPDIIFSVCWAGFGAACIAALLYFTASGGEPSGFRVLPTTASGWVGFYFRTLILVCVLSMLFGLAPYIHPIVRSVWGLSAFLLFVSSAAFWRSDRALCSIGFVLSGVSVLWAMLFPVIATSREV